MPADPLAALVDLPAVASAVEGARDAVDRLLGQRVLRRGAPEVSAESALRGVRAVSALCGVDVDLAELRSAAGHDPVVQGALRCSAALGPLAVTWTAAPRQALARLHVLAAADLVGAATLGRPRSGALVAARLDQLSEVLAATRAPAVVVAAVVTGELLSLDAFAPSSIVVAYAAARLTLAERGLDPRSLCVIEVGALETRADLAAALDGFAAGTPAGLSAWIEGFARVVVLGAREATAICQARQRG